VLYAPYERLLYFNSLAANPAEPPGTSVTTGAAEATKGTVVGIITSTPWDAYMIHVSATEYSLGATSSQACLDVLVGPTGTEQMLIPDLLVGGSSIDHLGGGREYMFPLYIPATTQISVKVAGQRLSTAMKVVIGLRGGSGSPPFRVGRQVTTYGISTVPYGTTVVPGASGAEGAWTQITAGTSEDHFALMAGFQSGTTTTKNTLSFFVDIGEGAATEEEIAQTYLFATDPSEQDYGPRPIFPTFIDVPSGTRLAMRASCNGVLDAGNYNGVIYGVS
jgi:hypothetical protein